MRGEKRVLLRLRMGVECVQAHTLILHVIPKQERIGTQRGRGKAGVPACGGVWGRKCTMRDKTRPSLYIFAPSPFVPELYVKSNNLAQSVRRAQMRSLKVHIALKEYKPANVP